MPFFLAPLIVGGAVYYVKRRKNGEEEEEEAAECVATNEGQNNAQEDGQEDDATTNVVVTPGSQGDNAARNGPLSKINRFLFQQQNVSIETKEGSTDTFRMMDKEVKFPKISYK